MSSLDDRDNVETWLSLVERLLREQEVAGSNPVVSTITYNINKPSARVTPNETVFRLYYELFACFS